MKFALDVAHLDSSSTVVQVATMPPGRLGKWVWRGRGVVEAERGAFARWGLRLGDRVEFTSHGDVDA